MLQLQLPLSLAKTPYYFNVTCHYFLILIRRL